MDDMTSQGYEGGQKIMMEQIRHEIETIEKSANRLRILAEDNPAMRKNAEVILTFADLLKFITPEKGKEEN